VTRTCRECRKEFRPEYENEQECKGCSTLTHFCFRCQSTNIFHFSHVTLRERYYYRVYRSECGKTVEVLRGA
jgi:hypothetical protein